MPIVFRSETRQFHLFNQGISYIFSILPNGQLGHHHFGRRLRDRELFAHLGEYRAPHGSIQPMAERPSFTMQGRRLEYPGFGRSDFRNPAFEILQNNGSRISDFRYVSHSIRNGKRSLEGLPATYVEDKEEAESLEIRLADDVSHTELILEYTIFRDRPALCRNARVRQVEGPPVVVDRFLSGCFDLPDRDWTILHLCGAWSRERHRTITPAEQGVFSIESGRGVSSAENNPFLALLKPTTTENAGEAYGFSLVYSGNFLGQVEQESLGGTRLLMGINPRGFSWPLAPGDELQAPEMVAVYSTEGLNGMSRCFHNLYRNRLVRPPWRDRDRPILVNSWESSMFDVGEDHILALAKEAAGLGIELFVLDDGWFGRRDDDTSSLGDWQVNRRKIPSGIGDLARWIDSMGLKFGIWIEPEMVNEDSDLFRKHPDWILQTPGRQPSYGRNQLVLDFSRPEVVDNLYQQISRLLREGPISYVKWDMNRAITDRNSGIDDAAHQGTVLHRYMLGVYLLYERLIQDFPDILFESCASGGARFDPGMLYYAPQTWTSDNTDAIERLWIQYGTSMVYPLSSMGAHVSAVPNQQVGRVTPLETRANVALFGSFGYEMDLTGLSTEERGELQRQIAFVKKHRTLIHTGCFYRLKDPDSGEAAWMVVSDNRNSALVGYYRILNRPDGEDRMLRLMGLDENSDYVAGGSGYSQVYGGDELMEIGLRIDPDKLCGGNGDFASLVLQLEVL